MSMFTSSPQIANGESFHRASGMPSFKVAVPTGTGFMRSSRMPFKLADASVRDLAEKKIAAKIEFDPE